MTRRLTNIKQKSSMGLSNVNITVNRDGLGLVAIQSDGAVGISLRGAAVVDKLELSKPYLIHSVAEGEKLGITATGANATAYRQVDEFYQTAGTGTKLYLTVSDKAAKNSALKDTLKKMLEYANGDIVLLGMSWPDASVTDPEEQGGLIKEVFDTQVMLQLLAVEYTNRIMPFIGVIEGAGFKGDTVALTDLTTMSNYRTAITLTATDNSGVGAVGQLLGAIMAQPVHRKISRVKNGALPMTQYTGFLTDKTAVEGRDEQLGTMSEKGYLIYRTFPGRTGYFYNGDFTATLPTDDLCSIARLRVMDKALKIAYNTYVNELDDEINITADGRLEAAKVSYLQEVIYNQVMGNMSDEISDFAASIDPLQNILSGTGIDISLSITPKGYLNPIHVTLGFINPLK